VLGEALRQRQRHDRCRTEFDTGQGVLLK
jgi:hypothetical protein